MIYLDNAATTAVDERVLAAMLPYFTRNYGNASSLYDLGSESKQAVTKARRQIARMIGARESEVYFTSGGSEADNWAIKSTARMYQRNKANAPAGDVQPSRGHIITTAIEHHAVLRTCEELEEQGVRVTYLKPDAAGFISPQQVEEAIEEDTFLISVMTANNEVGTIEPIAEIGRIAHEHNILFHTDAVQAFGHLPLDVKKMNIDLMSASGHKLHGPKGIGFLYIRTGIQLPAFIHGGAQERGRRAGTENVPAAVGFGEAAALAAEGMEESERSVAALRNHMVSRVLSEIPGVLLTGAPIDGDAAVGAGTFAGSPTTNDADAGTFADSATRPSRLPGNASFVIPGVEGETLLIMLDLKGIAASGGSACSAGSLEPSHVLLALGIDPDLAGRAVRFSLSAQTTREEIDQAVDDLKGIVEHLRS